MLEARVRIQGRKRIPSSGTFRNALNSLEDRVVKCNCARSQGHVGGGGSCRVPSLWAIVGRRSCQVQGKRWTSGATQSPGKLGKITYVICKVGLKHDDFVGLLEEASIICFLFNKGWRSFLCGRDLSCG